MPMYFISYHQDSSRDFVDELQDRLFKAGILTWTDTRIRTGHDWKLAIDKAIDESIALILVITPGALKSQYVTYEWSYASGKCKLVLPLILKFPDPNDPEHPQMHPKIIDWQYSNFQNPENRPWEALISELQSLEAKTHIPDDVIECVLALKSVDVKLRKDAIATLEKYEHPSAVDALAEAINSRHPDVCIGAGIALARKSNFEDERAITGLSRAIERGRDDDSFHAAISCLAKMNFEAAVTCLENHISVNPNGSTALIHGLCKSKHPSAVAPLLGLLETTNKNNSFTRFIIQTLGEHRNPIALPKLEELLSTFDLERGDADFLHSTVEAIGLIDSPDTPGILISVFEQYGDTNEVRKFHLANKALSALVATRSEKALMHLENISKKRLPNYYHRTQINEAIDTLKIALLSEKTI